MATHRPFRFIASAPSLDRSVAAWRDAVRSLEDLGFATVAVSDHLTGGWTLDPMVALMAAGEASDRLRLLSLVLANDFRHPALLHRSAAMIDVFSSGRLELGLGAGWLKADYQAAGVGFDDPATRIERLAESVRILKLLFGPEPATFAGRHYSIEALDGLPKPVQQPRPPILIGGGGRRSLTLAAREADIISVHALLRAGALTSEAARDLGDTAMQRKIDLLRTEATAAGRALEAVDLQFSIYLCEIHDATSDNRAAVSSFSRLLKADPDLMASSPSVLVGSLEECVEKLEERRERYGFNYLKISADPATIAPLVARLAGR
jgi:probable F420-dependent oxidoreductase